MYEIDGKQITRIGFEYGILLLLDAGGTIRISTDLHISRPGVDAVVDPDSVGADAVEVLRQLHSIVERAEVSANGTLALSFADGSAWEVPPHPAFEAWEYSGEGSEVRVICVPGGELVVWS